MPRSEAKKKEYNDTRKKKRHADKAKAEADAAAVWVHAMQAAQVEPSSLSHKGLAGWLGWLAGWPWVQGRRPYAKPGSQCLNPASWIAPIGTSAPDLAGFMAVGPDNGHLSTPFFSLAI